MKHLVTIRRGVKKYDQSEKGKEARSRYIKKYLSTEKGKQTRAQYENSEAYKNSIRKSIKKYESTDKGKLNRKKINRRQRETPERKIVHSLRRMLKAILREENLRKKIKFNTILGCSGQELKDYLERKFLKGMTWNNYGKWHIDHIIPVDYYRKNFDFNDPEVQKKCFHFSNLQPLWQSDNIKKSNKIIK